MLAGTHIILGISAYVAIMSATGEPLQPAAVAVCLIGSLLPDADHPRSLVNRLFLPLAIVPALTSHRGLTHTLGASAALAGAGAYAVHAGAIDQVYVIAFIIGYLSHIAADMLTPSGVPLFAPLSHDRIRSFVVVPTGGLGERIIALSAMAYLAFVCWQWLTRLGYL